MLLLVLLGVEPAAILAELVAVVVSSAVGCGGDCDVLWVQVKVLMLMLVLLAVVVTVMYCGCCCCWYLLLVPPSLPSSTPHDTTQPLVLLTPAKFWTTLAFLLGIR